MTSYIGPITNSVIEGISKELKKKETKDKIMKNIVNPLIHDVLARYYPYFISMLIIFLIIIILLVFILIVNLKH